MKRLRLAAPEQEQASVKDAKELLNRINSASEDLKNTYYCLFDNLNALYESYPDLYKQFEMVVKLPNNDDAKDITQLDSDIKRVLENFKDEEYLKSYLTH